MWGLGGRQFVGHVIHLIGKVDAKSVLDYGCGRGTLKAALDSAENEALCLDVREYDPGIEGKSELPEPADIVVCTDVLEHVEPDRLKAVLAHIFDLTRKVCFAVVATRPAEKRLPDGRNAHLIIDNAGWWVEQFRSAGFTLSIRENTPMHLMVWLGKP